MEARKNNYWVLLILKNTPLLLFILVFVGFGIFTPKFFSNETLTNIIRQSSYIGIVAVGMTFVLLTGGIDLSVGAIMYLSSVMFGTLLVNNYPLWVAILGGVVAGILFGIVNAFCVTKLQIIPFMVTLGTVTAGRGVGLYFTKSYPLHIPDFSKIGGIFLFGVIPMQVVIFAFIVLLAYIILSMTPFGRQVYAVGNDIEAAKKAGLNTDKILASVYIISGFCAAVGGMVLLSQVGSVQAGYGQGEEFNAIAASVLGGASLFGGIGTVFPGTVIGVSLIQMINAGLVYLQMDLYIQPMVKAAVIFIAIFIDAIRSDVLKRLERRNIRVEKTHEKAHAG